MRQSTARPPLPLWLLILIIGSIVGVSMGRAQSMGLYLPPVTKALDIGREPFGLAMALAQLLMGFGAPLSGGLIDRFGAGRVVIACVLATIAGLYFMYAATSSADLLISGVLMGIGVSGTGVTSLVGTIGRLAPAEKRLSAIASIGMAAGIGGFVALPVMHLLIELVGWQQSLIWLMAITALLIPLAWPISGKPSEQAGLARDQSFREALAEAFRHPSFWLLTAGFFVCGFHVAFIMVHLPAFTADQRHHAVRITGPAVARHHSSDERPGRNLLRHAVDVDAVRHRLPLAPDRLLPRGVARRAALRSDPLL
jgi:predicted MFS family arabinose efflux permease